MEISDIMLKTMGILKVWSVDDVTLYQDWFMVDQPTGSDS